jgi:hypothetical protein
MYGGDVYARSREIREVASRRVSRDGASGNINDHIAMWTQMLSDPLQQRRGFARTLIAFYVFMRDKHEARTPDEAYQILERGQVTNVGFLREMVNSGVLSETHRIIEAIRAGRYVMQ